ncbi:PEP-CTERM sorting domain-containing protein [Rubritalea sp.]|uniref:PEP-CTERM sorting domain-containing protein n=1 Tax=Rubritalea sp. TaxID=2109375 RepID=UPI003F4AA777
MTFLNIFNGLVSRGICVVALTCIITPANGAIVSYERDLVGAIFDPNSSDHMFAQNGADLSLNSGTLTFDTDTGRYMIDSTSYQVPAEFNYYDKTETSDYAVFNFSSINLESNVNITVTGSRGLALLSQSDFYLGTDLDYSGQASGTNGGNISLVSDGTLTISSKVSSNGANGANGGSIFLFGGPGSAGGNAGNISIGAAQFILEGSIEATGGNGGDAGFGLFNDASGGNGADGGPVEIIADAYDVTSGSIANNAGTGGQNDGVGNAANGNTSAAPFSNGSELGTGFGGDGRGINTTPIYISSLQGPTITAVPEPSSSAMLILSAFSFLARRKRTSA